MRNIYALENKRPLPAVSVLSLVFFFAGMMFSGLFAQPLNVTFTDIEEPACFSLPGGSVRAVAQGGLAPYTYTWSDGTEGELLEDVLAGTYSVTVVDAAASIISKSITILQPEKLIVEFDTEECALPLKVTAVPSGGVGPYTYRWTTGSTHSMTNVMPGVKYCVTVTDANRCAAVNCVELDFDPLSVNIEVNDVSCPGEEDGALTAVPMGGTPPFSFAWSNGGPDTATIDGLAPGAYTVTLTDGKGCTATATGNVAPKAAIEIDQVVTGPVCIGDSDGSINTAVSGGTPPYTYAWSNGANTADLSALDTGTYVLTVTDANNCPAVSSVTLEYQSELSIGVFPTPETCPGANDGFLTVTVNNGVGPYIYDWSSGATTQVVTDVVPGTYTVTVTDAVGCQDTATATVRPAPDLVVTVDGTDVTTCDGADGTATVSSVSGEGPFSYVWSNGATTPGITDLAAGTYTVTVSTPNQCQGTGSVTIAGPPPVSVSLSATQPVCPGEANGSVGAAVSGGTPPFSFAWSNGGPDTAALDGLAAGLYSVTVTDAAGCTDSDTVEVEEATPLEVTVSGPQIVCGAGNTGSAFTSVTGGVEPYTFSWSTGATSSSIAGLTTGTYSVTVTDAAGCTAVGDFSLRVIEDLDVSIEAQPVECAGVPSGSATATGTGGDEPYSFFWSTGDTGPSITGLGPGKYFLTLTDANNCAVRDSVEITAPPSLIALLTPESPVCAGESSGAISTQVSGGTPPYTYAWSTDADTPDISGLAAGNYRVTITDANGCFVIRSRSVNDPPPITIAGAVTDVLCPGDENGAIDLTGVTAGTPPYSFTWNTGATTEDLNNLAPGTYEVTVTDDNNCSASATFTVDEPSALQLQGVVGNVSCKDGADGFVDITVEGGTPPFSFAWSDGSTGEDLAGVGVGSYTVIVTDASGCQVDDTFVLTEPEALVCAIEKLNEVVLGEDGSLSVTAMGGTPPYSYAWSNGGTMATIEGLDGGTYSVTVTDANGCTTNCTFDLVALAGLGDFVWEDIDRDGIQDQDEPPLIGVLVRLKNADGVVIDSTTTDINGFYSFVGLEAGTYSVQFVGPEEFNLTVPNAGANDALDSDADPEMDGMTATVILEPGDFNPRLDAGFYLPPSGAVTDPCVCLNNSTTEVDGQFLEEVTIRSYPDETWTIIDQTNMFLLESDPPPAPPIPVPMGTIIPEVEPGVYEYTFKLVDEQTYMVFAATNGVDTIFLSNTCFYPVVNATELPSESICVSDDPIPLSANPSLPGTVKFYISGEEVTEFDPGDFGVGEFDFLVEFTPDDPDECITTLVDKVTIVDDCFAKIGDLVWYDLDRDGLQGSDETGIADVKVTVTGLNESEGYMDMMMTDENGMYMFRVPPGTYKLTFEQPEGFVPTVQNSGSDDALDSDADPDMLMTQTVTLEEEEVNLTLDAGFYIPPTIAISDPCTCLNNATNEDDGQFSELLRIESDPGQTWTILANTNMFLTSSPPPPPEPIPVPIGTQLVEVEPGVYEYDFILVDEDLYSVLVTNGMDTLAISNVCFYPTVNVNELPGNELCVGDPAIPLSANPSVPGIVRFYLDGVEVTEIDPATIGTGSFELLVEFTPDDPEECIVTLFEQIVINNNCLAKIGDYVWHDRNEDGIQGAGEEGIGGVEVTLTEVGVDEPLVKTTTTDSTGMYMFLVPPGDYKVTFGEKEFFNPTVADAGADDALDSDMDPVTRMTPVVTLMEGEMNLTLDAGLVRECINVTDPGEIGYDQYLCGPGNDPEPFVSLAPATGGEGELEYLWMFSNEEGPFDENTWTIIPNSNSLTYDPGIIYETTYFARCARREGCPGFLETTIVTVTVGNEAFAEISGPGTICENVAATFEASGVSEDAEVSWSFGAGAQPATATGPVALVKYTSFGTFTISMTVTEGDCVSTITKRILVTNNPAICGEGFVIDAEVTDELKREVRIDWQVPRGDLMRYTIEHSADGENFTDIGREMTPLNPDAADLEYLHWTEAPKQGYNFYRVKMSDMRGNNWYSNVEMVTFYNDSKLALLYPNPTRRIAVLEIFESFGEDITVELVNSTGQLMQTWEAVAGSHRIEIDLGDGAAGMYFLRIRFGDTNVKAIRLMKR